jgi:hypothetical protein
MQQLTRSKTDPNDEARSFITLMEQLAGNSKDSPDLHQQDLELCEAWKRFIINPERSSANNAIAKFEKYVMPWMKIQNKKKKDCDFGEVYNDLIIWLVGLPNANNISFKSSNNSHRNTNIISMKLNINSSTLCYGIARAVFNRNFTYKLRVLNNDASYEPKIKQGKVPLIGKHKELAQGLKVQNNLNDSQDLIDYLVSDPGAVLSELKSRNSKCNCLDILKLRVDNPRITNKEIGIKLGIDGEGDTPHYLWKKHCLPCMEKLKKEFNNR